VHLVASRLPAGTLSVSRISSALARFAYLAVTNMFAALRLLPISHREKDAEILTLRHQVRIVQEQPGNERVRFERAGNSPSMRRTTASHRLRRCRVPWPAPRRRVLHPDL